MALVVKNLLANAGDARDLGLIPGLWKYPGGGHGNPLQYSCLENPMDRGAWWATVHGVTKSQTRQNGLETQPCSRIVIAFLQGASVFWLHGCSHCLQWFWSPRNNIYVRESESDKSLNRVWLCHLKDYTVHVLGTSWSQNIIAQDADSLGVTGPPARKDQFP